MKRKKLINKITTKKVAKSCYFCGIDDYAVLHCHRIVPGEEGGKYEDHNVVVCCANCHGKVHAGQITIDRKYFTSAGKWVLHFWEGDEEKWK